MGTLYRRTKKGNWQAEYTNHTGERIQKSTKTADKRTAAQIMAYWETEAAKRSSGFIDHALERIQQQATRPIAEHKAEWIRSIESKGNAKVHTKRHGERLQAIIDHCDWAIVADITPESVDKFTQSLRDLNRSNQTVAHYVQAVKQFTRWLSRTGRIPRNPLETLTKPNPKADRRRIRRMLLPDEWHWLRQASTNRAILYELAIQTGLRSNELRSLHPSHLKLTGKHPHVLVSSGNTKDNETARQYITRDFAKTLANLEPANRQTVFALPDAYYMASMLRDDLAIARASWLERPDHTDDDLENDFLLAKNDAGEALDFHALRHTCGAWLAIKNVHPKTIQTVMRHASITLTMDTYGHLFPNAEPEAIEKLGSLLCQ
ncbi:tyrosine-type recombinase/integrase [Novipirellula artificiosorum]|uniref:Site-specific tyrosine recombinase XerC n=1 Tax=Novipirellula artificiosorum TaxID=2528016 RepID=A0A5C6DQD0_9BACT|nr:tyrosine-type recombinase/integrase [Novipirellula artificiosorum]TWU37226.1 site-specific tyrosine recombinase XerC [Novipirellula artificiosorum]